MKTSNRKFNPRDIFATGLFALPPHALAFKDDPDDPEDPPTDPDPDDSPSGDPADPTAGAKGQPADPAPVPKDDDDLKALKAKLEKERKAREKLEAKEKAREDAKKTELEKAREQLEAERQARAATEERIRAMEVRDALRSAAMGAGVRPDRLDAVLRVVDKSGITTDEDGELVGVKATIDSAKSDFPEFFGGSPTANPGTGGGKQGDRPEGDPDGPQTDYDLGRALAKGGSEKKTRI